MGQDSPARIVLLKEFDQHGFVWFSDSRSEKGQALAANPKAELLFYWRELERQVRIRGVVSAVSEEAAEAYFSFATSGQLAAATSVQSQTIESRAQLEDRFSALEQQSQDAVARPEAWGGLLFGTRRLCEFWQGRESRLHDRFRYRRESIDTDSWLIERLQP